MGSPTMIGWLVQTAFYVPLTFETGMAAGSLSIIISQAGLRVFRFFSSDPSVSTSRTFFKVLKGIVRPIHCIEELLSDPNYADGVAVLTVLLLLLAASALVNFLRAQTTTARAKANAEAATSSSAPKGQGNELLGKDDPEAVQERRANKWKAEATRLLSERKDFVAKIEQVEKLNKRYREAIFQIEQTYNEEHKLKKLEQKRLKNLTKFMEQCSVIVSNRKDKLDDTLKENALGHKQI